MIVDIHTHLWRRKHDEAELSYYAGKMGIEAEKVMTAEGLLRSMDRNGIDLSVVLSNVPDTSRCNDDFEWLNNYVYEQIKAYPDRFLAFCNVNTFDIKSAVDEVKKRIETQRFVGLKIHPNGQEIYPNNKTLYPLYELMEGYRLPVMYHTGGIGIEGLKDKYGDILAIEEVATDFPEMPIIMGHAGRGSYPQMATVLRKHSNVYADVSANFGRLIGYEHLTYVQMIGETKIWTGNADKLLFGSDYPLYGQKETKDLLIRCVDTNHCECPVTEDDINGIINENAVGFLKKYGMLNR